MFPERMLRFSDPSGIKLWKNNIINIYRKYINTERWSGRQTLPRPESRRVVSPAVALLQLPVSEVTRTPPGTGGQGTVANNLLATGPVRTGRRLRGRIVDPDVGFDPRHPVSERPIFGL